MSATTTFDILNVTGSLGTPAAGVLTNCTGLPIVAGTTGTLTAARGGTGLTELPRVGAYKSASDQAITGGAAAAIVVFDVEEFDTGSDFASNTFTVPFTGSCRVWAGVFWGGATPAIAAIYLYKNGSQFKRLGQANGVANGVEMIGSCLIAVTAADTLDIRAFADANQSITAAQAITWVQFEMGP